MPIAITAVKPSTEAEPYSAERRATFENGSKSGRASCGSHSRALWQTLAILLCLGFLAFPGGELFFLFCLCLYYYFIYKSDWGKMITSMRRDIGGMAFMQNIKNAHGTLKVKATAYHEERRTTGHGDNRRTRTVRVTTWEEEHEFTIAMQEDDTTDVTFDGHDVALCWMLPMYSFMDEHSANHFNRKCKYMRDTAALKDKKTTFSLMPLVPELKQTSYCLLREPNNAPAFLSSFWFVLSTLVLCTVPYRMWVEGKSRTCNMVVHKKFSLSVPVSGAGAPATMNCTRCGGTIGVPKDADRFRCPLCDAINERSDMDPAASPSAIVISRPATVSCSTCTRTIGVPPGCERFRCPLCNGVNELPSLAAEPAAPAAAMASAAADPSGAMKHTPASYDAPPAYEEAPAAESDPAAPEDGGHRRISFVM
eukprot:PLAT11021.1.p1 GENE.PLAT11021.1~~PLAT11021.1.p1  ORF type:complete len:423 (+),score=73.65 PLAT11021.1:45-1313(+)